MQGRPGAKLPELAASCASPRLAGMAPAAGVSRDLTDVAQWKASLAGGATAVSSLLGARYSFSSIGGQGTSMLPGAVGAAVGFETMPGNAISTATSRNWMNRKGTAPQ